LCGRFVCAQMALRCSIQRGVRILYTYTCVHTHTRYTHLWREKKGEEEEESRVWSARRVINERRIPADKEEPPRVQRATRSDRTTRALLRGGISEGCI
jgi:hypothetical protein